MSLLLNLNQLYKVAEACKLPNWDGNGANPMSPEALALAIELLETFGDFDLPSPEIACVPNGDVCFDWDNPSAVVYIDEHQFDVFAFSKGFGGSINYEFSADKLLDVAPCLAKILSEN